jgi:sulfite reductase beta subunit-like hemoprotein
MKQIEELQKSGDQLDALADIYRYARNGDGSPGNKDLFRKYGIYTQRPAEDGFFMVRIRIPGGNLKPAQLRAIAELSEEYGRGLADITVRQNIQLHWVRRESLPVILDRLREVGLSTTEAFGEGVRNILNCPASGVDEEELYDTTPLIGQVNDFFATNRDFSDLPRKFKIAITGCAHRCVYPEINDIGIFAVRDEERRSIAFRARVGGGLSTAPRFSKDLGVLVAPEEVVDLCAAIATVFREQSNGSDGKAGRIDYVLEEEEIPQFRQAVEAVLGRKLRRAAEAEAGPVTKRDRSHLGIHRQREPDSYYLGISIVGGRTRGFELKRLAEIAEKFGSGRMRTTNTQNILLLDIAEKNLKALKQELDASGFDYHPSWARKGILACTGIQFCKLAIAETKNRAKELEDYLSKTVEMDDPVRISVTGCPNSCGQHQICDVGLEGSLVTLDGVKRESFQVFLGGGVGAHETIGRRIGVRIPSEELAESMARLFSRYKNDRLGSETFQAFCLRHSDENLAEYLAAPVLVS